jgi:hypothetical protein
VVQFPPNEPITLALKYAKPKIGMRPSGDDYAMFTTVDDRMLFLDVDVARQITDLDVKPGEAFRMEMQWSGKRSDPKIYHAWQDEPDEAEPAETALEAQLRASIEAAAVKKANARAIPQLPASNPWLARCARADPGQAGAL